MNYKWPLLDLHGKRTDEVFDLVDRFVTKNSNSAKILIMTGHGSGAIKKEVKKYLKIGGFDSVIYQDWAGKRNSGILEISLK